MAASNSLTLGTARELIRSAPSGREFDVLQYVASLLPAGRDTSGARDLLLRVLDNAEPFAQFSGLLNSLLRSVGLFPYLSTEELSLPDLIAYEAHRPVDYDQDIVFHEVQARVYRKLLAGENVILSAPTSFGKSLVLDALISSERFENIAVVLPTIALIDETRRRLSRFRGRYKIITHPGQPTGTRNVLVMTQERLLDMPELPNIELFMIDEFYKLDIRRGDRDRGILLNQALRRLMQTDATFYLAGPNIQALAENLPAVFSASFIATDFATVASDVKILPALHRDTAIETLSALCSELKGPTLIYCSSPNRTRQVTEGLMNAGLGHDAVSLRPAADWLADNYHEEWLVSKALRRGIGIHHGKIPRSLAQYQVSAFNEGKIDFLVCTSTLIEGVNTSAKNVVIFDHKLNRKNLDYFTFSNIKGRSGRMMRHFVGNVFVFRDPPRDELPTVDVPLYSQGPEVPDSLLIQLSTEELTTDARRRMEKFNTQTEVPLDTLRGNTGLDPNDQISLAKYVRQQIGTLGPLLSWRGFPRYEELEATCDVIAKHLHKIQGRDGGVSSPRQLAYRMNVLANSQGDIKELIDTEIANPYGSSDATDAVEQVLDFVRQWAGFEFPRLLTATQNIVSPILREHGYRACDYRPYAVSAQNLFLPPYVGDLEEYGLPAQLVMKILGRRAQPTSLDNLLAALASTRPTSEMNSFEGSLLSNFQRYI
ncbi:DEAD/DEAH box helicase [Actinacidiphila yanglinensis]|uniref:DEAD/DEAH box helicase n=1 Tax=Actinacidiphila yanglinensis TaxID=310779 RepID=A0A1H6BUD0_9ACTN|nr:DEAD/DEAH box helicase [Actinacidiphila yanglinensis]SEG64341.1 DEAD/DEAH box helicase [Actinacidiphila yanglinensis]